MPSKAIALGGGVEHAGAVVRALARRVNERRLVGLASESAFWLSLALVPLAAVSGLLVARVALSSTAGLGPIFRYVPIEGRAWVQTELSNVASYHAGGVAPLAAGVFVWLASSGVHGIFDAFEAESACCARPWWKKRAIAIVCCLVLAVGGALIAYVGAGMDELVMRLFDERPRTLGAVDSVVRFLFSAGVDLAMTAALYRVGIDRSKEALPILPGAVLATVLHVVLGSGYAAVIRTLGDSSAYLAGLAVIAVSMTAMFLYAFALLLGLGLNAILGETSHRPFQRKTP